MQTYTIRLTGPVVADSRIPVSVARELLNAVESGARGAVRLRLEGRSRARGPSPAWLNRAADFDLVDVIEDEAGIRLQAPTLGDALPDRFAQTEIFAPVDPEKSALAFLSESLDDAVHGRTDSEGYDDSLLGTFHRTFGELLQHGVEAVEIRNGRPGASPVLITSDGLRAVEELHHSTPAPRRVRLAGWLDTIRYSDRAFALKLESGKTVRGVLAEGAPELLMPHFGKLAVVSGVAHYRPSGALLRVDAEQIAIGSERDAAVWGEVPGPLNARLDLRDLRKPQTPRSGLAAIVGLLEDELADEDLGRLIEEVS